MSMGNGGGAGDGGGARVRRAGGERGIGRKSMTRAFFDTPLGQVHYVDAGPAGGEPVVLLHQTPRSVDEYAGVIPRLAASHRVLAMDTPGYGCSDRPAEPPEVSDYAAVVLALLDHLGLDAAHLVGHHTGAVVAIETAAAWPDRVRSLVLSGPVYLDEETRAELGAFFAQWRVQPDGSHLAEKWQRFNRWTDDPALVQRALVDLLRAGERSEDGHFAIARYRMEDRLTLVRAPALLVFGRRDPFGYTDKSRTFEDTLPESRTAFLGGGVFLPSEEPEAFARLVMDFLGSLTPG